MKKMIFKLNTFGLFTILATLFLSVFGIMDASAVCAVSPIYGSTFLDGQGTVIDTGEYSLTEAASLNSGNGELLSKHFLQEVIRVDPYSSPTMSILAAQTNWKRREKTKDHTIQVNRITTPPIQVKVATQATIAQAAVAVDFGTQANKVIGVNQTIYFTKTDTICGYKADGTTADGYGLVCRVLSKNDSDLPVLIALNGKSTAITLTVDASALRGDRIGTESQQRTAPFGLFPSPTDYFVPKKLIEFGTTGWFDAATKNIRWGKNEAKENAVIEMMRTSAPGFWLGKQMSGEFKEYVSEMPELAYFPEGLIHQAGRTKDLNGTVDVAALLSLYDLAFRDNGGGNTKIFAMGSTLSPLFQELILNTNGLNVSVYNNGKLNIDFTQVQFVGGKKMLFIDDPSLDDCGLHDKGFILDVDSSARFAYAYDFVPIKKENEKRDYEGMSIIDESINVLSKPNANVFVEL